MNNTSYGFARMYTQPNTSTLTVTCSGGESTSHFNISGDVELERKPDWIQEN